MCSLCCMRLMFRYLLAFSSSFSFVASVAIFASFSTLVLAAMSPISKQALDEISAIINMNLTPVATWNNVAVILERHGLIWEQHLPVEQIMVSTRNRAGLGVNAYNAHAVGSKILKVGADLKELGKATCFEMSPNANVRDEQVAFNRALVESSQGLLAPLTNQERYVSVSCSHTTQFCRAVNAGCKTPHQHLADSEGKLMKQLFLNDRCFASMLTSGWTWQVVAWQVAEVLPFIPDLAEKALNASNNINAGASELEVAARIANEVKYNKSIGLPVNWTGAIQRAGQDNPACLSYIDTICSFVKLYGGGDDSAMLSFLENFSKKYGERVTIGKEFWQGIISMKGKSDSSLYLHVRIDSMTKYLYFCWGHQAAVLCSCIFV